jgi:hypothetical protein
MDINKEAEALYEKAFYDKDYDSKHGILNMKQRVMKIMNEQMNSVLDEAISKYVEDGNPEIFRDELIKLKKTIK